MSEDMCENPRLHGPLRHSTLLESHPGILCSHGDRLALWLHMDLTLPRETRDHLGNISAHVAQLWSTRAWAQDIRRLEVGLGGRYSIGFFTHLETLLVPELSMDALWLRVCENPRLCWLFRHSTLLELSRGVLCSHGWTKVLRLYVNLTLHKETGDHLGNISAHVHLALHTSQGDLRLSGQFSAHMSMLNLHATLIARTKKKTGIFF